LQKEKNIFTGGSMKLTKKKAKELSLIKWDYARKTGCTATELTIYLSEKNPFVYNLHSSCGMCEYTKTKSLIKDYDIPDCSKCPLAIIWDRECDDKHSLWSYWQITDSIPKRKKYAEQIYQDIKKS
jgi:hypothetical protein